MISIRNINPMARAIGTMGVVAVVAGGITFASLSSNSVALSPNTLSSATAALAIGGGTTCPSGNTNSTTGLTASLVPGQASAPFAFCLDNTGNIPLGITAQIPTSFASSTILPTDVTLSISCPNIGTLSGTLDQYSSPVSFPGSDLAPASPEDCTATATLASNYSGSGTQTVTPFDIDFVGNQ